MKVTLNVSRKCYFSLIFFTFLMVLHLSSTADALVIQAKSPCDNTDINSYDGIITSPNYPSPYPEEVECEWEIKAPSNAALQITVLDLDINEDDNCPKSPCCSRHRLSISREGGPVLLCGNNTIERTIWLYQPLTFIKYFSSKANKQGRGFKITYSVIVHNCKANGFQCTNGKCVPKSSFCDGVNDCGDDSDEIYCLHLTHSSRYNKLRSKSLEHEKHVFELSPCEEGMVQCPLSPDHCYSPLTDLCDDKFDCPKGEDEVDCVPGCPKQISCSSGDGCYYPLQRCNSVRNCRDNSDETGCPAEPCVALQFTCLNGACVSGSAICDGDDDCGDFSDEKICTKSSFMKAAVVGLLTCIMLFCIVLGCMYHVYTARLRASANFVHQLETEPSDEDFVYREPPPSYSVAVNDPRIIAYPTAEITDRFFENDHTMRFQRNRSVRRNRRRQHPESTPASRSRTGNGGFVQVQNSGEEPRPKTEEGSAKPDRASTSDFRMEFCGFGCPTNAAAEQILPGNSCRNESPCSSPSLSPSRESITSCTSLEEIEDLVSLFHH